MLNLEVRDLQLADTLKTSNPAQNWYMYVLLLAPNANIYSDGNKLLFTSQFFQHETWTAFVLHKSLPNWNKFKTGRSEHKHVDALKVQTAQCTTQISKLSQQMSNLSLAGHEKIHLEHHREHASQTESSCFICCKPGC